VANCITVVESVLSVELTITSRVEALGTSGTFVDAGVDVKVELADSTTANGVDEVSIKNVA
jgi:hypothetical protein